MAAEQARRFEVAAPGKLAWGFLILLGLVLPMVAVATLYLVHPHPQKLGGVLAAMPLFPVIAALALLSMQRRSVTIEQHQLVVRAAFYTLKLPLDAIDLPRARVISLAERRGMKPWLKTNAMSLPGFHAGNYRSRDLQRVFALVTDDSRVLALPELSGRTLLLSVQRPQALLDAIETARRRDREQALAATRHG
jgi:hypothetical protein